MECCELEELWVTTLEKDSALLHTKANDDPGHLPSSLHDYGSPRPSHLMLMTRREDGENRITS